MNVQAKHQHCKPCLAPYASELNMELVRFSYTQPVAFPFSDVGPKCLQGLQRAHKMECVQDKHIYIIHVACVVNGIHVQTEAHSAQRLCCRRCHVQIEAHSAQRLYCRRCHAQTLCSGCVVDGITCRHCTVAVLSTVSRADRGGLCTVAVLLAMSKEVDSPIQWLCCLQCHVQTEAHSAQRLCCRRCHVQTEVDSIQWLCCRQ